MVEPIRFASGLDLISGDYIAIGMWVKLPLLESIEIAELAGFDFVVIDLEHSTISVETAARQVALARACGVAPLVRVPLSARAEVGRILDAGAAGVIFPSVSSVSEAEEAVSLCRFPPVGNRGAGPTSRAGRWGLDSLVDYLAKGRSNLLVIGQIESSEAARNVGAIAAVKGIDALLVGQTDLAVSMGATAGDVAVREVVTSVERSASAAQVPLGTAFGSADGIDLDLVSRGYKFAVVSNDVTMLASAAVGTASEARARLSVQ